MPHSPRTAHAPDADEIARLRTLLARGRWFGALPQPLQAALLGAARWRRLDAGTRLFARGDPDSGLYCVVEGVVRIGSTTAEGLEAVLSQMETAQWFGEIALFDRGPRTHDADAVVASRLLWVPRERLEDLIADEPLWWRHFGELLAEKIRAVFAGMEQLALLPASARIARRLHAMADGHGMMAPGAERLRISVNQAQLGAMLSLTRQTVSEVLRDFEVRGWLRRHYGEVELLDIEALRQVGDVTA
jgi:CRP-like cAMP-binding protein